MMGLMMVMSLATGAATGPDQTSVEASTKAWHAGRIQRLTSETGYLTLVGLVWLKPGTLTAGTAADKELAMPKGMPTALGTFTLRADGAVVFAPEANAGVKGEDGKPIQAPLTMQPDSVPKPTVLKVGTFSFFVIRRLEKTGLRIRNTQAETAPPVA